MSSLKRLLNPAAAAAKRYMTTDMQSQLVAGLEKLRITTQENSSAVKTLKENLALLDNRGHCTSVKTGAINSVLDAAQMLELNTQIIQQLPLWQACDSILTCPITLLASEALFPDKAILQGTEVGVLLRMLAGTKVNTIGIVSPWLFFDILMQPHGLHTLLQACRRDILFIVDGDAFSDQVMIRQAMHRVGFYNVSIVMSDGTEDFISTGCMATGEFLLAGSEPALPSHTRRWIVYKATRAPDITTPEQQWRNILSKPFQHSLQGFTAEANGFALAVCAVADYGQTDALRISGTMSWTDSLSADHASLVGSYHGSGDTNMYASMVQISPGNNVVVSLWVNHGVWERLEAAVIPTDKITLSDGVSSLPLWLQIAPSQIKVGSNDTVLIDVKNDIVRRTPCVGIRVSGSAIAVSNIHCVANKPCP